jgi:hypothetical protein
MKNIVGPELVTEIKQWSDNDPAKNQQFIIEQNGSPGFVLTDVPLDYVCLPVDKFLHLFEVFKCTKCHARHQQKITLERYCYVQSLYYVCTNCEEQACIRANLTRDLEAKWKLEPSSKTCINTNQHNIVHASMFEQNIKVYLAIQQCGGGRHESKVLRGMFGIHSNPLQNSWMRLSENIGLAPVELGLEILGENREVEKVLSPEKMESQLFLYVGTLDGISGVVVETTPPYLGTFS